MHRTLMLSIIIPFVLLFADKKHLERYGRFITGDTYSAMENGPVPSFAYDVVKCIKE